MKNLALSFLLLFFLSHLPSAHAATLSNDSYILQTNDTCPPSAFASNDCRRVNQSTPIVKPSPTPEPLPKPFAFSLSTTILDFGQITPTDPTTRTTTIHVNPSETLGFSLFAITDHELQSENKKIIPDTTCDNGTCTSKYASTWDSILTYGLGYRYDSIKDFMQLPNQAKGHVLSPIIFGNIDSKDTQVTITYKTNVSTTQDIGLYTNTLSLIAIPDF